MRKRIEWLDIAKGICILLVVLGHELTWDEGLRYSIYAFHIPVLFVLSGMTIFITRETEKDFSTFLKKNVNGLLKPYMLGSFLYIVFDIMRCMIGCLDACGWWFVWVSGGEGGGGINARNSV